ncbi:MAG: hypothetical protein L6Q54_06370 [Leptospiraceae bacterium]|nr:hypothetical protein [Leptospiraceae bacterium]
MKIRDRIAFARTAINLKLGFAGNDYGYKKIPDKHLADKLLSRCAILETFIKDFGLEKDFLRWCDDNLGEERNEQI